MRKNILYPYQQKYLKSLQQEVDSLLHQMEEFASVNKIPILNRESAEFLEQVVLIHRPKRVLEIGMAIGYSSIRVARNLRNKSVIDTIELSKDNVKRAKKYIAESSRGEKINIIEGDALKIMPKINGEI